MHAVSLSLYCLHWIPKDKEISCIPNGEPFREKPKDDPKPEIYKKLEKFGCLKVLHIEMGALASVLRSRRVANETIMKLLMLTWSKRPFNSIFWFNIAFNCFMFPYPWLIEFSSNVLDINRDSKKVQHKWTLQLFFDYKNPSYFILTLAAFYA